MKILGIEFKSTKADVISAIPTDASENNATIVVDGVAGGFQSSVSAMSIDNTSSTENGLIEQYRAMAQVPEVAQCVQEIISESIVYPGDSTSVLTLDLSNTELSESIKTKLTDACEYVYDLLMFNRKGHDIFKRWYVDGRLHYFINVDAENVSDGIQSVQFVDPRKIKKVREVTRSYNPNNQSMMVTGERTYFLYNERGLGSNTQTSGIGVNSSATTTDLIISSDSVVFVPSGITDPNNGYVLGPLHNSIRTANNLRMMEDAVLIYRLARAPERRAFYVETGDLSKAKAEQYVEELARKNRSKVVYDANTGDIKNDKKFLALTEDFWMPRRNGSTGTSIDVLPGGAQVGEMGESEYFKAKLYTALGVPASRFEEQSPMFGGGTSITRDELRFSRIISKYRNSFSVLFEELLKRQAILTNILSLEDWDAIKNKMVFKFAEENHFSESVRQESLRSMAELLGALDGFVGKYFSREYIFKEVIGMTDDEMKEQLKLIAADPTLQVDTSEEGGDQPTTESFGPMKSISESFVESDVNDFIDTFVESIKNRA